MTKKKIAVYCDSMNNGGTEKATLDLVNNLPKEKYDITVIQLGPGGKYQKELAPHIKNKEILPFNSTKQWRLYWWSRRFYEKLPISLVHRLVLGNKYDVEIGCGYGYPTRLVAKAKKAKSISWIHMDVSMDKNYVPSLSKEEGKEYFKGIDEFVCVSKDCAKKFNEKFGFNDKTTVCYNIIDAKKIRKKSLEVTEIQMDKKFCNFVSIGRLTWQKGFDILIEAIAPLIKKNNNIRLYILGDGEEKGKLQGAISKNGLDDNIFLLGHIANPYPVMKQADAYICSSRHESFSLTVAESIILELPIVSTKCTGPVELLDNGKYGIMCECTEEEIRNAITLMISEKTRKKYKEKVRDRKAFFSIEKSIAAWERELD